MKIETGAVILVMGLAACADSPSAPSGLTSRDPGMQTAPHLANSISWRSPDLDPSRYNHFTIGPVKIYDGPDAEYGSADESDKQIMATFLRQEFARTLNATPAPSGPAGPGAARLDLTLAGMTDNVPVASTAATVLPIGLVRNLAAQGQSPMFSASVTYKGEIYDGQTGQLVAAFVTTKTSPAMDLGATLDSHSAQQAAITAGAEDARDAVLSAQQAAATGRR